MNCKPIKRLQIAFNQSSLFQSTIITINATLHHYENLLSSANYYHIQNQFTNNSRYGLLFSKTLFESSCDYSNISGVDYARCLYDNTTANLALMPIEMIFLNDMQSLYLQLVKSNDYEVLLNDGTFSSYFSQFTNAYNEDQFINLADELEIEILAEYAFI